MTALLAAGNSTAAQPAAESCKVERKAQLPLTESHGRFSTPILIDQQPLPMLIDTGAQRAGLSRATADRLKLGEDPRRAFRSVGIGGRGQQEHPRIAHFIRFGGATWPNYPLQTAEVTRPDQANEPGAPVGLIGADMLSAYDVEFDFPRRTLTLYAVSGCTAAFAPWTGPYDRFAAEPGPADLFIIPVTIDGHRLKALVDTGSNTSSLGLAAALQAGVGPQALTSDPLDSYVGSDGAAVAAHRHRFGALTVGGATFSNVGISVRSGDFAAFDMLLGVDFLASRRVWLSFATRQVFIRR